MNWIIRQIARFTLLGKLVEKLGPKVPIIFILLSLIFAAFYIPYEYENILEFRQKYPNDVIGLSLNLARPSIIILILSISFERSGILYISTSCSNNIPLLDSCSIYFLFSILRFFNT